MTDRIRAADLRALHKQRYRGRSNLYRYIRANFDALTGVGVGTKDGPTWDDLTVTLIRAGQRNVKGAPLTRSAVVGVYKRVERDVAAEATALRAIEQERPAGLPSRLPATWRPEAVARQSAPTTPRREPAVAGDVADRKAGPDEALPDNVQEQLASLDRQFAWADRHLLPPPKRGG